MELSSSNAWDHALSSMGGGGGAPALPIVLLLIAASFLAFLHRRRPKSDVKYPPHAPGGLLTQIMMRLNPKTNAHWVLNASRELDAEVIQLRTPSKSMIAVGELNLFREILTDPLTTKPGKLYGFFRGIYGGESSVFTTNGPEWHRKRKACASAFSSNQIKRMTSVALEMTDAWIENKLMRCYSFDVAQEMIGIVLSALSETAFEYEMNTQEKELFGNELCILLVEYCRKTPVIPFRDRLGWLFAERRRAMAASKKLKSMVLKIMKEWREKEHPVQGTLIHLIMDSDAFPTEDSKAAQLLEFLLAGHDTTAYSIAFTLIELAKNPNEQRRLREALRQLPPESWSSCEELQRVVKEGYRLHPVGRSLRLIGRDMTTNSRELLPKGSLCVLQFQMLFRNPRIFDEPDTYRPSRWEHPTREMLDAVNPFSLGRQNCVGQSLARAETCGIIARICSEFELSIESEGSVSFFLTVKPAHARLRARRV